ncbi:MAG TPA: CheB methylesterase domain-containing protein, partial [Planctomycetaceae bacterium]
PPPAARRPAAAHADPQVLVVGASTGGPKALTEVLAGLGRGFRLPILLVQHMPPLFTPLLARHLEKDCGRPAGEAADGEPILPGRTYVAPGGFHLAVERRDGRAVAVLTQEPPEHFCRPSVNPLFRSAARVYGPAALAVMLTGMGEDGLEGAHEVVAAGGRLLAQDEATSVVWGMPGAVARAGLAEQVLPLDAIAPAVRRLCRTEPR